MRSAGRRGLIKTGRWRGRSRRAERGSEAAAEKGQLPGKGVREDSAQTSWHIVCPFSFGVGEGEEVLLVQGRGPESSLERVLGDRLWETVC